MHSRNGKTRAPQNRGSSFFSKVLLCTVHCVYVYVFVCLCVCVRMWVFVCLCVCVRM